MAEPAGERSELRNRGRGRRGGRCAAAGAERGEVPDHLQGGGRSRIEDLNLVVQARVRRVDTFRVHTIEDRDAAAREPDRDCTGCPGSLPEHGKCTGERVRGDSEVRLVDADGDTLREVADV